MRDWPAQRFEAHRGPGRGRAGDTGGSVSRLAGLAGDPEASGCHPQQGTGTRAPVTVASVAARSGALSPGGPYEGQG